MRFLQLSVTALLVATASAAAQGHRDEAEIRRIIAAHEQASAAHDLAGLVALYSTDAEMISPRGMVTSGRDSIEASYRRLLASASSRAGRYHTHPPETVRIRFVTADVALVDVMSRSVGGTDTAGVAIAAAESMLATVWRKRSGKWMVVSQRTLFTPPPRTQSIAAQDAFWGALQNLCGRAYSGRVVEGNASDSAFRTAELRMHVRECGPAEIRVPFHAGSNRSRTWVITRTGSGLRLKHDHRHEDGTEDPITQYGGDTRDAGTTSKQEFHADAHTAAIIPAARTNIWTIELLPGDRFAYALRREGTDRRFRVEFDLKQPIPVPPAPWGAR